jgi:uncharacterized protein (TIGR00730 family)
MDKKINSLAVFCGARDGSNSHFKDMAFDLGKRLAHSQVKLVYGGGRVGLMGHVSRGCLENGGYVIGVIPKSLMTLEVGEKRCSELHVVETMHHRKALMAERADAFMAIPGGFGTLDEIFEIITWKQLQFHKKPIVFLNHQKYFDGLLDFCAKMKSEGFISDSDWNQIEVYNDLDEWAAKWANLNRL